MDPEKSDDGSKLDSPRVLAYDPIEGLELNTHDNYCESSRSFAAKIVFDIRRSLARNGESFDDVPSSKRTIGLSSAIFLIVNRIIGTG